MMHFILVIVFLSFMGAQSKVFERCELARELINVHEAPRQQVATWVCIAEHESQYNTSATHSNGDRSIDHGLFQISDLFWCSPPGNGWACGVTCAELEDDNIEDDFICAKRIYREHKKLTGDGFNAWVVYRTHCSGERAQKYVEGCFDNNESKISTSSTTEITTTTTTESKFISALKPQTVDVFSRNLNSGVQRPNFDIFSSHFNNEAPKSRFDAFNNRFGLVTPKPIIDISRNSFSTQTPKPRFDLFNNRFGLITSKPLNNIFSNRFSTEASRRVQWFS